MNLLSEIDDNLKLDSGHYATGNTAKAAGVGGGEGGGGGGEGKGGGGGGGGTTEARARANMPGRRNRSTRISSYSSEVKLSCVMTVAPWKCPPPRRPPPPPPPPPPPIPPTLTPGRAGR